MFEQLVPIYVQSGYSVSLEVDTEKELVIATILLPGKLRFKQLYKANIYPRHPCQTGINGIYINNKAVAKEQARAKSEIDRVVYMVVKEYESKKEKVCNST